mgnify:CR=1 FL=1
MNYFKKIYEDPSRNLNSIIRYSGVYCIRPETDSCHVIDMMAMCRNIADIVYEETCIKLDLKELIYRCYTHDLDEVLTGDVQRGLKYYNNKIHEAIDEVSEELLEKTYRREFVDDIRNAKDINDPCGIVVKMADTLQSSMKIYEEYKLGNFHFLRILKEHNEFLNDLLDRVSDTSFEFTNTLVNIIKDFKRIIELECKYNINNNF